MLYFIANHSKSDIVSKSGPPFSGSSAAVLKRLELFETLGDLSGLDSLSFAELPIAGPGGNSGVMLSVAADGFKPMVARFNPERQAWKQVSSAVWIGTESNPESGEEVIPEPEWLARSKSPVQSYENVMLANGTIWEVPVIREPLINGEMAIPEFHTCKLPSSFARDVAGQWRSQVLPKYSKLWAESQALFEKLIEGESVFYSEAFTFAADVLALRYRFNLLIHSRWPDQFLTTENVFSVVRAAVGWNILTRFVEDQKKSQLTVT
jgi:hypothetical protein